MISKIKYSDSQINRILIIIILFLILLIMGYIIKINNSSEIQLTNKKQEQLMKSIVKIEYYDNEELEWIGSGVFFSKNGLILTNNHLIEDQDYGTSNGNITICVLENIGGVPDCSYKGKLIIRNPSMDLAVIKILNYNNTNYINIFDGSGINTTYYGKGITTYGYPWLGGDKITITKGIISGFDDENNIKTDAEINGGNSGGGAFIGNLFIGIPSSVMEESAGKIGYIISKNKIFSWFGSISNKMFDLNNIDSNFENNNLLIKGNNILNSSSYDTPYYLKSNTQCKETFGENSYYTGMYSCDCYMGFEFGGNNDDTCVLINN